METSDNKHGDGLRIPPLSPNELRWRTRRKFNDAQTYAMRSAYRNGKSIAFLARTHDCAANTIWDALRGTGAYTGV